MINKIFSFVKLIMKMLKVSLSLTFTLTFKCEVFSSPMKADMDECHPHLDMLRNSYCRSVYKDWLVFKRDCVHIFCECVHAHAHYYQFSFPVPHRTAFGSPGPGVAALGGREAGIM